MPRKPLSPRDRDRLEALAGAELDADALERLMRQKRAAGPSANGDGEHEEGETQGWPEPPGKAAFSGLAGEIVSAIEPHSEADPVALLLQLLLGVGNAIGHKAHFAAEGDRHFLNEFAVLVGRSSKARKGTSWGQVRRVLDLAEPVWAGNRILGGLSSGEGLIWAVRDPITTRQKDRAGGHTEVETDAGIADKRLLVYEAEFAGVLKTVERQGNTLSPTLRSAWETGTLGTMTKNNPARSTGAHISVIGHITAEELRRYLSATEAANGFGNRFLWACVKRSKCLPDGGALEEGTLRAMGAKLAEAIVGGKNLELLHRADDARDLWHRVYPDLSEGKPGLAGALLGRAEAHVMRLACLYSVLDHGGGFVQEAHLKAALALWDFCERSVRYVWGEALGDPVADDILRLLKDSPEGVSRTDISHHLGRHQSAERIARALALLQEHGLARREERQTKGRTAEVWLPRRGA